MSEQRTTLQVLIEQRDDLKKEVDRLCMALAGVLVHTRAEGKAGEVAFDALKQCKYTGDIMNEH